MEMILSAARAALTGLLEKCRKKPAAADNTLLSTAEEKENQPRLHLPEESKPEYQEW